MDSQKTPIDMNSKPSRTNETAEKLISFILSLNMKEGDRLPNEAELSSMLKVSRSTLREAIKQLVGRNILDVKQGSGTYISSKRGIPVDPLGLTFLAHNKKLAMDLIDVRIMLEPHIAAAAAIHATEEECQELLRLSSLHASLICAGEDYQDADTKFHEQIAKCSGNAVLVNLIPIISSSVYVSTTISDMDFRQTSIRYHQMITEAICRKDFLGAQNAMLAHLNTSRDYFIHMDDTVS